MIDNKNAEEVPSVSSTLSGCDSLDEETAIIPTFHQQNHFHKQAPLARVIIDDLGERKIRRRVPTFVLHICAVQILIFVITNECMNERLMFIPAERKQWWRYFTYMFVHFDVSHLVLNVCLQSLIGFALESEQGHQAVALIYMVGGISGSLATTMMQPQLSLLGASAGVYALLMSHIPHMLKNFHLLSHRYLRIVVMLVLCVSDVCFTTFHYIVNKNSNPRICLVAHISGGISGLAMGFLVFKTLSKRACDFSTPQPKRSNV